MLKTLLLSLAISMTANAKPFIQSMNEAMFEQNFATASGGGLNWKVGDTATYNMNVSSFISGSMVMTVKAYAPTDLQIEQALDLGALGKQDCITDINPTNGKVIKLVCNGKDQDVPAGDDLQVVQTKEDKITVPAGTFDCVYIKAKSKTKDEVTEQWANATVPVTAMVKTLAPSQLGTVDVELKSFQKQP